MRDNKAVLISTYKLFCTIAEVGNMTHAAELCHISPSAASHAISTLEKSFGFALLNRDRTGAKLTPYGKMLLPRIQAIIDAQAKLHDEIDQINGLKKGSVYLGILGGICTVWLPLILDAFNKNYPDIDVKIYQNNSLNIEKMLIDGSLDLGFVTIPISITGLKTIKLIQDQYVCITPPGFIPENNLCVTLKELRNHPLILANRSFDYTLNDFLLENKIISTPKHSIALESAVITMVESGMGISIFPELALKAMPGNYRVFKLEVILYRTIGLAMLLKKKPTRACDKMIQEIQKIIALL